MLEIIKKKKKKWKKKTLGDGRVPDGLHVPSSLVSQIQAPNPLLMGARGSNLPPLLINLEHQ